MSDVFRPISELDEADDCVVIDRRGERWHPLVADAVERAVDDGETSYLMEDGRKVAVIKPFTGAE